jgi:STE24 endopeptidase
LARGFLELLMDYNLYFYIILFAIVGIYLLDLFADLLNLKALQPELPEDFKGVFDAEKYAKSQDYTRETTRFGVLESTAGLMIFIIFWFAGGFGWLDGIIRGWGHGEVTNGLFFFGILYLANEIIGIPFELYDTFVIEEKYGFNKTSIGTFFMDKVKGLLLAAVLGAPLLALILWLFGKYELAWLYGWLAVTGFSLLMAYIAPKYILPLFNKFKPLENEELKDAINAMARKCEFPLTEVAVMDGSKRSAKSNAFFTGFGKNKKIALFDTLIEKHSVPELVAVLAHEIGHFKKKHIVQTMALGIVQTGVIFFLIGLFMNNEPLSNAFGVAPVSVYCSLTFFMLLFKPISKVLSVLMAILSRKNEFEADAYASEVTGDPHSLISALKSLSLDNLSNLTPHWLYVFMHYSHPPMTERLAALKKIAAAI